MSWCPHMELQRTHGHHGVWCMMKKAQVHDREMSAESSWIGLEWSWLLGDGDSDKRWLGASQLFVPHLLPA